jgi:hypothetical protein
MLNEHDMETSLLDNQNLDKYLLEEEDGLMSFE